MRDGRLEGYRVRSPVKQGCVIPLRVKLSGCGFYLCSDLQGETTNPHCHPVPNAATTNERRESRGDEIADKSNKMSFSRRSQVSVHSQEDTHEYKAVGGIQSGSPIGLKGGQKRQGGWS